MKLAFYLESFTGFVGALLLTLSCISCCENAYLSYKRETMVWLKSLVASQSVRTSLLTSLQSEVEWEIQPIISFALEHSLHPARC